MSASPRPLFVLVLLAVAGGGLWFVWTAKQASTDSPEIVSSVPSQGGDAPLSDEARIQDSLAVSSTPALAAKPFVTEDPTLRSVADAGERLPVRLNEVSRLLSRPLTALALAETIEFLQSPVPTDSAAIERERALRNSLLNRLRDYPEHAASLVPALATQAADATQDPGLRDYALQHLAAWAPKLDDAMRAQAFPALLAGLQQRDGTYAGTALVGLNDLAKRGFLLGDFDAAAEARSIALDEGADVRSRLTALALISELGGKDDELARLAGVWSAPGSSVPEGARRVAQAYLNLQSLN